MVARQSLTLFVWVRILVGQPRDGFGAFFRGVAQFGRALRSGRRGRGFESRHFDYLAGAPKALRNQGFRCFFV